MNGRGWKWRHNPARKAASSRAAWDEGARDENLPAECAQCTPLLTALFDGEASEAEIQRARRHLLGCQRCAQTWLGWNQTRALLLDQSVPRVPPTLVGRIRLACGLAGKTATPDLHAQILARTSRQNLSRPAQTKPRFARRQLSSSAPVWGATALGAFVLMLAGNSLFSTPAPQLDSASLVAQEASSMRPVARDQNTARPDEPLAVLPMEAQAPRNALLTTVSPANSATSSSSSGAALSLLEAKRERESLSSAALQSAPLPVLASLAFEDRPVSLRVDNAPRAAKLRSRVRREFTARREVQAISSPPLTPHVLASRPIVLASVAAPTDEADLTPSAPISAPVWSGHRGRFLLASAPSERAPLRISAPRVRPITVGQNPVGDDASLDDLDSTVQAYRSSLSDDASDSNDAG